MKGARVSDWARGRRVRRGREGGNRKTEGEKWEFGGGVFLMQVLNMQCVSDLTGYGGGGGM